MKVSNVPRLAGLNKVHLINQKYDVLTNGTLITITNYENI